MLAVEHAGKKKPPEPTELAVRLHGEQRRLERGRAGARGFDPNPEPRPGVGSPSIEMKGFQSG